MGLPQDSNSQTSFVGIITEYVVKTKGLNLVEGDTTLKITQKIDQKFIEFDALSVSDVLDRKDENGSPFLQVNFNDGRKILVTDTLIGFRPLQISLLDMTKLPRVVTTPDVQSIFDAIQEALHAPDESSFEEVEVLRKVFEAVIMGGEAVGFSLEHEKGLLKFIPRRQLKASA